MEQWIEIRSLSASGLGIRAIARRLRVSRNTVRNALRGKPVTKEALKRERFAQLIPYRDEVLRMLKAKLIGTRILNELRRQGYAGGATALYDFMAELRKDLPHQRKKAVCRFETAPGVQAQFDWSPYEILLGGVTVHVIVYDLILAYCRRKFYWPSFRENQESVFEALERGFQHFGGTTSELLVDNPRVFVIDPRPGHFTWNPHFLDFCKHYRLEPRACLPRRPETKGKVERPFYFLEQHFIKGNEFVDFPDFCRKLSDFNMELDYRMHQALGIAPIERFEEEREALCPLPTAMLSGSCSLFRKVSWDCLISYDASKYSVPFTYAGKDVWVRVSQGAYLEILSRGGEKLAYHKLSLKKGSIVIDDTHYEGLKKQSPRTMTNLRRAFEEEFPEDGLFLEKLIAQQKQNTYKHLRAIIELLSLYPREKMREAFAIGMQYNAFSSQFICGFLEKRGQMKAEEPTMMSMVPIPKMSFSRSLADYGRLISNEGSGE
jgi:transposase